MQPHVITLTRLRTQQQGFALVLALWVLSLLTIMAGSFALNIKRESAVIASVKNSAEAHALAETGLTIASLMLLNPDEKKRWRADGSVYQITDAGLLNKDDAEVRIRMISENGKIDINKAEQKLLAALLAHSPIQDEHEQTKIVSAIMDWRDEDDLLNIDGAEADEYKDAGLKYKPRNKPFQTLGELQMVLGMTPELYQWLTPLITVYSGQANVNARLATKEVLRVLPDIDEDMLDTYFKERTDNINKGLPPPPLPFNGGTQSNNSQTSSAAGNQTLTIIAEAQLDDGSTAMIHAVIATGVEANSGQLYRVLEWQRNAINEDSLFAETLGASAISDLLIPEYDEPKH